MIQISADLSDPLLELLPSQPGLVDALEVGPWFSLRQVEEYRAALPGYPFYFHGADLLAQVGWEPSVIPHIAAYTDVTDSPWISMHMGLWPPGAIEGMRQSQSLSSLPDVRRAFHRLAWQAKTVAHILPLPLLLENVEPQPFAGAEFEVQARLITQILETTGCGFLLDLGHALISASVLGLDVHAYLSALPLERVEQVHLSGPRPQDGRLIDAHEELRPEDYDLLDYILTRCRPRLVTLEYIRQPDLLNEQLIRLREILDSRPQAP